MKWIGKIVGGIRVALGGVRAVSKIQSAIKETAEAVETIKGVALKYRTIATSEEARADLRMIEVQTDEALEAIADVTDLVGLRAVGRRLRGAIDPSERRARIRAELIEKYPLLRVGFDD